MSEYCSLPGEPVPVTKLVVGKAQALARYLVERRNPYATFAFAHQYADGSEAVIFDVVVEVPQIRAFEIQNVERIATVFYPADDYGPETLALREGFPLIPHVNPREQEFPRSLCLTEESYAELRLRWTPALHIEHVRIWLSDNAAGVLHRADQPVEQVFVGPVPPLILPADFARGGPDEPLYVSYRERPNKSLIFVGSRQPQGGTQPGAFSVVLTAPPTLNQQVRKLPSSFASLHDLLIEFGIDLVSELSIRLRKLEGRKDRVCIVIVKFPRIRKPGSTEIERYETWAFASLNTVEEIGTALGLWQRSTAGLGALIGQSKVSRDELATIKVFVLDPVHLLSRTSAALFNRTAPSDRHIAAIGAGTLGSRVIMNCVRAGYGTWTIIDSDYLAPHNIARHELTLAELGDEKALAVAQHANEIFEGAATGETADVLQPGAAQTSLDAILGKCDVICDMSASLSVARSIATDEGFSARRVSLFLNPRGDSLVALCEDHRRHHRLDDIEIQYYRHIARTPDLHNHLSQPPERIRYARSCRDVSSRVSNEDVLICAAAGSRLLRRLLDEQTAAARIITVSDDSLIHHEIPISSVSVKKRGRWTLRISDAAAVSMRRHRQSRLPKETGGVLIGTIDFSRSLVYVADALGAPADSEEYPTAYIRGTSGLKQQIEQTTEVTDGQLQYLGEWHSHPDGYSTAPSDNDRELFTWLEGHLAKDGRPAVMCIVGQTVTRWFVERCP